MNIPSTFSRFKGLRFPREAVVYAVWAYRRIALSAVNIENRLAERGVIVSRESVTCLC